MMKKETQRASWQEQNISPGSMRILSQVCTDNGPQFASREFASLVRRYDFEHITSIPEFQRSDGLAEKGVQIVKRILKKTHESRGDVWLGQLACWIIGLLAGFIGLTLQV